MKTNASPAKTPTPKTRADLVPEGACQFCMYSTTVERMREVQGAVPDPRGDFTFGPGEECFTAIARHMSYEEVLQRFPLDTSQFVDGQATLGDSEKTVVRRHPELFVAIVNESPAEQVVIIARISGYSKSVEKSKSELRGSGREGRVDTQR